MWQNFLKTQITDPNEHRPESFCYIVHGVAEDQTLKEVARELGISFDHIHLIKNPHNITSNPLISVSLINQDRRETFASSGLILRVAADHVVGASMNDLNRDRCLDELTEEQIAVLRDQFREREVFETPENLLDKKPSPEQHNEIVITPVSPKSERPIEVIGFFVKTKHGLPLPSPKRLNDLESKSAEFCLPIVPIEEKH